MRLTTSIMDDSAVVLAKIAAIMNIEPIIERLLIPYFIGAISIALKNELLWPSEES